MVWKTINGRARCTHIIFFCSIWFQLNLPLSTSPSAFDNTVLLVPSSNWAVRTLYHSLVCTLRGIGFAIDNWCCWSVSQTPPKFQHCLVGWTNVIVCAVIVLSTIYSIIDTFKPKAVTHFFIWRPSFTSKIAVLWTWRASRDCWAR